MRDRHLHVPRGFPIPAALAAIAHADVSLEAIEEGWDEYLGVFTLPGTKCTL